MPNLLMVLNAAIKQQSLDFTVNQFLMKLFKPLDVELIV